MPDELPRLALRLHGGVPPARCAALARAAEEAGFHSVWFAENPFGRGVLPAAAACAVATQRIRIGIGVFNPYNRHPTLMAMEMGALDELSGGRAALGIGAGVPGWVRQMGFSYDRPLSAVRDALQIARPMLAGKEASYRGTVFSADRVRLGFAPLRYDLPIFIGAMGDRALRLCGELADGLIISNMCPPAYTARARELVRDGARAVGRAAPAEVVQYVPCAVRSDGKEAREAAKVAAGATLLAYWQLYQESPGVIAALLQYSRIDPEDFRRAMDRLSQGESARAVLDDRFVETYAIAGTVAECSEQCATYWRSGVTELALTFVGDDAAADIRLFGRGAAAPA